MSITDNIIIILTIFACTKIMVNILSSKTVYHINDQKKSLYSASIGFFITTLLIGAIMFIIFYFKYIIYILGFLYIVFFNFFFY